MKLTLQIKLLPTCKQVEMLKDTFSVFNKACNAISQIAWERRVFKQFGLHKEVYYPIKETYRLSSQLVVRAISKVADAYKLDRKKQRCFREFGAITYDSRVLSYNIPKSICSISLIGGREKIAYTCYRPHLMQFAKGEADLVLIKGKFYLYQTIEIPDEEEEDAEDFIGVDMGITDIVSISDGTSISSNEVKNIRDKYNKVRASIQSKGTRNCHKLLKRLRGREKRFATIVNHSISKWFVAKAKKENKGIAIEDLKNIRFGMNSKRRNKTFRRRSNSWSFYQLRSFLEYKCKMNGVKIIAVPPAYTSQTCHECKHIGIRNGKRFHCKYCGNIADADINAARNIATWGYVNTHERWELLSCSIHDDISTSKAHKSLVYG